MPFEIRRAEHSDIPGIRAVATDAWHEAHAPIIGTEAVEEFLQRYYNDESFTRRIDSDEILLDVATDADGDVVGYVLASPSDDADAAFDLGQIYVAPDRWGKGIGRQLLGHVERSVADRGGERIVLGVMAENDRALGFYADAGFERIDEVYDDRIDTTSYVLRKELE